MTPLERAVDRRHAALRDTPLGEAIHACRVLAFDIMAAGADGADEATVLARIQTLAAQIDGRAEDAFEAKRRPM